MDDVLRRLGSVEKDVSVIKTDIAGIVAVLPHLATKADFMAIKVDVMAIKADVAGIMTVLPHLATKADVMANKADVSDAKTSIIQWMVGTVIAMTALAFTVAKFVH